MKRAFFAALSFEPRALAGLTDFLADLVDPSAALVVLLDYRSSATQSGEASRLRNATLRDAEAMCLETGCSVEVYVCSAYSARALWALLREKLSGPVDLTVDISCMTRPHVIALASWLSKRLHAPWQCRYTMPESYGNLDDPRSTGGWRDTLLLSLGRGTRIGPERNAVGLLVCGHESARTALALDELEPSLGLVLVSKSRMRPDFYRVALGNNMEILSRLLTLQYPTEGSDDVTNALGSDGWELEPVDVVLPIGAVTDAASRVVAAAKACDPAGSVVLYPFGPKNVVFAAALTLASQYGESSWSIVPIHRSHGIDYSSGVAGSVTVTSGEFRSGLSEHLEHPAPAGL